MTMTPQQKIKWIILHSYYHNSDSFPDEPVTVDNIDDLYDEQEGLDFYDYEIRKGEVETEIPSEYSRHYENQSVAAKAPDGTWVGWTYWYGGGKHGEPEAIDWVSEAYHLNCKEEERLVVVQTFTKA